MHDKRPALMLASGRADNLNAQQRAWPNMLSWWNNLMRSNEQKITRDDINRQVLTSALIARQTIMRRGLSFRIMAEIINLNKYRKEKKKADKKRQADENRLAHGRTKSEKKTTEKKKKKSEERLDGKKLDGATERPQEPND